MKKIAAIFFAILPSVVFADMSSSNMEEFLSAKGDNRVRWETLLKAECMGALNQELNAMFYAERRLGHIPEFSPAWCIKNKIVPGYGDKNKRS